MRDARFSPTAETDRKRNAGRVATRRRCQREIRRDDAERDEASGESAIETVKLDLLVL